MPTEAPAAPPATAPAPSGAIPVRTGATPVRPTGPTQVRANPTPTNSGVIDMGPKYPLSGGRPGKETKPGDAKKGLFDKIASKAKAEPGAAEAPPAAAPATETPEPGEETPPAETPATETPPADPNAKPAEAKKGKVNPWKLVDEHKAARAKAETEIAELRKLVPNVEDRKKEIELVKQIHDRNKQLEDEIRYVRYEQSTEFKEKYDAPYTNAWKKAMTDLEGVMVNDGEDGSRAVTPNDMLTLVNLPVAQAQHVASEAFGDLAGFVMAKREKIRELNDARMEALETAKTKGAERDQQRSQQIRQWNEQTSGFIKENWDTVNKATLEGPHGEYFKPREGDADWNQRLAKGYELADRAFVDNIKDPKLTREQRESIIKRHAAMRMRCAGWGPLKHENGKLKANLAALEKELAQYKGTTPGAQGRETAAAPNGRGRALDQVFASIAKRAKVY